MKIENLKTNIRNMTDEEMNRWNASSYKGEEYIVTIYLQRRISDMLPSKIGTDTQFYKKTPAMWEVEYIDKSGDRLEDIEEILIDDFIEAFIESFDGDNYEIEAFRERFGDVLAKYQGEFEEKLQERLEEFSDLKEVLTMTKEDAIKLCRNVYSEGWIDFRMEDKNDTVSLEMSINIYGDEYDLENPFDLVFYDEQGFEHYRVPKLCSNDSKRVEEYDNLVRETLNNLEDILQYVYDYRDSYEFHEIELGDYKLIISLNYNYYILAY